MSRFTISTLNKNGSISKKMLNSFSSYDHTTADSKDEAIQKAEDQKKVHFNPNTVWVVIDRKQSNKVIYRTK